MIPEFIVLDTETGGFDKDQNGLLTASFLICDSQFNVIDKLELFQKTNSVYTYTPESLEVTKINLEEHNKMALSQEENQKLFVDFLKKYEFSSKRLIPIAHNLQFDVDFIISQLCDVKIWRKYISYSKFDTLEMFRMLVILKKIKPDSCKLSDLAKYFDIKFEGHAHNSTSDALVCVELMKILYYKLNLKIDDN